MMMQRTLNSYSPIQLCHISPLGYLLTVSEKGQSWYLVFIVIIVSRIGLDGLKLVQLSNNLACQ